MINVDNIKDIIKNSKEINIICPNDKSMGELLKLIDNDVNDKGYIINKSTKELIISNDSAEIKLKELGAVMAGSKVFIKKNIASFSDFLVNH